jgi:hypothetical protein
MKIEKNIIVPKSKDEKHIFKNNIKPNSNNNYENIRNIVEDKEPEIQENGQQTNNKQKFNIV